MAQSSFVVVVLADAAREGAHLMEGGERVLHRSDHETHSPHKLLR